MKIEIPDELVVPIAAAVDEWKQSRARHPQPFFAVPNAYAEVNQRAEEFNVAMLDGRQSKALLNRSAIRMIATCLRAVTEVTKKGRA